MLALFVAGILMILIGSRMDRKEKEQRKRDWERKWNAKWEDS